MRTSTHTSTQERVPHAHSHAHALDAHRHGHRHGHRHEHRHVNGIRDRDTDLHMFLRTYTHTHLTFANSGAAYSLQGVGWLIHTNALSPFRFINTRTLSLSIDIFNLWFTHIHTRTPHLYTLCRGQVSLECIFIHTISPVLCIHTHTLSLYSHSLYARIYTHTHALHLCTLWHGQVLPECWQTFCDVAKW